MNNHTKHILKKIKFSLVFFLLVFINCNTPKNGSLKNLDVERDIKNRVTKLIMVPLGDHTDYSVRLKGSSTNILGESYLKSDTVFFEPVLPLEPGNMYEVWYKDDMVYEFSSGPALETFKPNVLAIYPQLDTVPENLLKMYIQFDKETRTTKSVLDYIKVMNKSTGKEIDVFLPLENELWNQDHTRLTLWLDPGRIKKDLIPNKEKGIPIQKGNSYTMIIDSSFVGYVGMKMAQVYSKEFYVGERDSQQPDYTTWEVFTPEVNTQQGLIIDFQEPLDAILIDEMITILNAKNQERIDGYWNISSKGDKAEFIPYMDWKKSDYIININGKLEDLAGNNLNRLFDVDLKKDVVSNKGFYSLSFTIN